MSKLIAWFTGIILVVLGALVAFVPFGNPISEYLATKNAEIYLDVDTDGLDLRVDERLSFKGSRVYKEGVSTVVILVK